MATITISRPILPITTTTSLWQTTEDGTTDVQTTGANKSAKVNCKVILILRDF